MFGAPRKCERILKCIHVHHVRALTSSICIKYATHICAHTFVLAYRPRLSSHAAAPQSCTVFFAVVVCYVQCANAMQWCIKCKCRFVDVRLGCVNLMSFVSIRGNVLIKLRSKQARYPALMCY